MSRKTKSRTTTADSRCDVADDPWHIPEFCVISQEQRAEAWRRNPPKPYTLIDPKREKPADVIAFEAAHKERQNVRLRNLSKRPPAEKVDFSKMRWDPRRCKFVPIFAVLPKHVAKVYKLQVGDHVIVNNEMHVVAKPKVVDLSALARQHGVWDDKYAKLAPGLQAMTIRNRLRALERKGTEIKW